MYFLLKIWIFHCYVSLPGVHVFNIQEFPKTLWEVWTKMMRPCQQKEWTIKSDRELELLLKQLVLVRHMIHKKYIWKNTVFFQTWKNEIMWPKMNKDISYIACKRHVDWNKLVHICIPTDEFSLSATGVDRHLLITLESLNIWVIPKTAGFTPPKPTPTRNKALVRPY